MARPDGPHHTEAATGRFDDLMESYGSFLVQSIVHTCGYYHVLTVRTEVETLQGVVYSSNEFGVAQEKADRIILDLREAKIYDYSLHQHAQFNKLGT